MAAEQGGAQPELLPAAVCDYSTGYLAAYGTLLALGLRARVGGSYHVQASLCQSAMLFQRRRRVVYPADMPEIEAEVIAQVRSTTQTPYGEMQHLGPILKMSQTPPRWTLPSSPLGTHTADWLQTNA
jgi:crotonobetainyl-CoA:carnitine CoA-transferase CaiB-like acyl-CoA transferase